LEGIVNLIADVVMVRYDFVFHKTTDQHEVLIYRIPKHTVYHSDLTPFLWTLRIYQNHDQTKATKIRNNLT